MTSQRSLYEPALDGLRLVAFLAVFFHHVPTPASWGISGLWGRFHTHGWSGVELFFVISSYLLFHLLDAEYRRTGDVNKAKFYIRRILRIYPLMAVFSAVMLLAFSDMGRLALLRFLGILTFTDNIVAASQGYNNAVPFTGHLWTLGFEFQFYLTLPFVFLAWKAYGTKRFLTGLAVFYALCVIARTVMTAMGVGHPVVWVTPILQPDAMLLGIVLATGALERVRPPVWPVLCAAAGLAFLAIKPPWAGPVQAIFSYMLVALASGALVQSARLIEPVRRIFSSRPVVYLGTISFGLYVFHLFGIVAGMRALGLLTGTRDPTDLKTYIVLVAASLAATVVASALSYRFLELPFLRLKDRFSVVFGREAIGAAEAAPITPAPVGAQLREAGDRR